MVSAHCFKKIRVPGIIILAAAGLAMNGCTTVNMPTVSVSQVNSELTEGYLVDAGDKLKVTVFDEPTLTGEYEVGVGGALSLPLVEALSVKGKTTNAISRLVEQKLADGGYVLYPKVSVEILEHRPFYILGQVTTPGEYPYNGDLTLEQAVAKAGGYTPRADRFYVVLRRQEWPESKRIKLGGVSLKIAPGDTIVVRESFF